jgi:hypothetical protein
LCGARYTSEISWKGQKSANCGEVTANSTWNIQFSSNLWHCREEILENYKKENFIPRRAEILEIQQKKDCLEESPQNQGLKVILCQHATKKGNFYTK